MPAIRYTFSAADIVSDELRAALRRRLHEIMGLILLALAGIASLALATWSVQDPSLSHATNAPVRNTLGLMGAISADLMMQLLGIATVALLFPLAAWGWRLLTHRTLDRERSRLVLWVVATLAAAGFASCLPASKAWPLPTGLGGVIGDALLRLPAWVFGAPLSGATRFVVAVVIGMMALAAIALAAGFGWHDEIEQEVEKKPKRARKPKAAAAKEAGAEPAAPAEPEDQEEPEPRALVSLGWFYHGLYSLKTQLMLLASMLSGLIAQWLPWRRRPRVVALRQDPSLVKLAEPYSNPADDQADELEDDEEDEDGEAAIEVAPRKHVKPAAKPAQKRKDGYEFPSLALLAAPKPGDRAVLSTEAIQENATALESVLGDFCVRGEIINAHPGPVVTLYELEPAPRTKSSRVIGLADDIARSMSKVSARVAVVQGRNVIGIELPNQHRETVYLSELVGSP